MCRANHNKLITSINRHKLYILGLHRHCHHRMVRKMKQPKGETNNISSCKAINNFICLIENQRGKSRETMNISLLCLQKFNSLFSIRKKVAFCCGATRTEQLVHRAVVSCPYAISVRIASDQIASRHVARPNGVDVDRRFVVRLSIVVTRRPRRRSRSFLARDDVGEHGRSGCSEFDPMSA